MKQLVKISIYFSFVLFLLPAGTLWSETRYESVQLHLGWQNVEGNRGYAIEVEDTTGRAVVSTRVSGNEAKLDLKPGNYRLRIAALNKFGKPSVWTDWNEITVTGKQRVQEFTARKEQPQKTSRTRWFSPHYLVPGMPRLERGDRLGYAWIGLFSGITLYGLSEKNAGTAIAHKSLNDPVYLVALSYTTNASLPVMLLLRQNRESDHARYDAMQDHQRYAVGAFLLFYGLHYLDAIRLSAHPAKNVEAFVSPSLDHVALFSGGRSGGRLHGVDPGAFAAIRFGVTIRY